MYLLFHTIIFRVNQRKVIKIVVTTFQIFHRRQQGEGWVKMDLPLLVHLIYLYLDRVGMFNGDLSSVYKFSKSCMPTRKLPKLKIAFNER